MSALQTLEYPGKPGPKTRPLLDRLSDKFVVGDGCWDWLGAKDRHGYGVLACRPGPVQRAHRLLFVLVIGPIPEGLDLDHLCRNRGCVRPAHLEAVTRGENLRRGWAARKQGR